MIPLKSEKEILIMKEGGKKLKWVFRKILKKIKPGVKLKDLNQIAERLILEKKGFPSFKLVKGYQWATCLNINEGVVHGIPNDYQIKEGDLVTLDMGMYYQKFHTDKSWSVEVKGKNSKSRHADFLSAGKIALKKAILAAKPGNRIGHISLAIEKEIRKNGFSPVELLTGHGVGRRLHESPPIPCSLKEEISKTPLLKTGMTLAIEVIYCQGKPDLVLKEDGWTLQTADGKLAAVFEETIVLGKNKALILT